MNRVKKKNRNNQQIRNFSLGRGRKSRKKFGSTRIVPRDPKILPRTRTGQPQYSTSIGQRVKKKIANRIPHRTQRFGSTPIFFHCRADTTVVKAAHRRHSAGTEAKGDPEKGFTRIQFDQQ